MSRQPTIRPATVDDIDALLDLYLHLSPDNERYPVALARRNLARLSDYPGSAVLLGEIDNAIIATCTLVVVPNLTRGGAPYALVENVVTHADHRGRGYGKQILEEASSRAWEHGCYKIMLSTGSTRSSTTAFYESAGFEQTRTGFQKRRIAARKE